MSTVEDFENAPVGATATRADGSRAMKMNDGVRGWITPKNSYLSDKGMVFWNYTLDPTVPATAREALEFDGFKKRGDRSMSDYVPSTQQVRDGYRYDPLDDYYNPVQAGAIAERKGRDFDRWLEQVRAEARAGALADAGLSARPLPTREEIADVILAESLFGSRTPIAAADAVLALLKGQES